MWSKRCKVLTALATGWLLTAALWAQVPGSDPVPDAVLYQALFDRIDFQKHVADKLASEKKDDKPARNFVRDRIGFTEAEYTTLETVALDFKAVQGAFFTNRSQLLRASGAAAQKAQLQTLQAAFDSQVQAHIAQLQTAFGPTRFQVLDDYDRREILPRVGYKKMTKGKK